MSDATNFFGPADQSGRCNTGARARARARLIDVWRWRFRKRHPPSRGAASDQLAFARLAARTQ